LLVLVVNLLGREDRVEERGGSAAWVLRYVAPRPRVEVNLDRSAVGADEAARMVRDAVEGMRLEPGSGLVIGVVEALRGPAVSVAGGPVRVAATLMIEAAGRCDAEACDLVPSGVEVVEFYPDQHFPRGPSMGYYDNCVRSFWLARPARGGKGRDAVFVEGSTVVYQYHACEVVVWDRASNTVTIDHCGWHTPTTRDRINAVLARAPFRIPLRVLLRTAFAGAQGYWNTSELYIERMDTGSYHLFKDTVVYHVQTGEVTGLGPEVIPAAPSSIRQWLRDAGFSRTGRQVYSNGRDSVYICRGSRAILLMRRGRVVPMVYNDWWFFEEAPVRDFLAACPEARRGDTELYSIIARMVL